MNRRDVLGLFVGAAALPVKALPAIADPRVFEVNIRNGLMTPDEARALFDSVPLKPEDVCNLFVLEDRVAHLVCGGSGFVAHLKHETERFA